MKLKKHLCHIFYSMNEYFFLYILTIHVILLCKKKKNTQCIYHVYEWEKYKILRMGNPLKYLK